MEPALKPGRENWYRNETWSFRTECAFLSKLGRTRGQGAQCLAIQIHCLAENCPKDALRLAELYFDEWADPFHDGQVHVARWRAHAALDELHIAADCLEEALVWQQDHPEYHINAELAYAMFVAEHSLSDRYSKAKALATRIDPATLHFPLDRFRLFAALALIASEEDEPKTAKDNAALALAEAEKTSSEFSSHPDLGLVSGSAFLVTLRLKRLQGQTK